MHLHLQVLFCPLINFLHSTSLKRQQFANSPSWQSLHWKQAYRAVKDYICGKIKKSDKKFAKQFNSYLRIESEDG